MEPKRCYGCMKIKTSSPVCEHCGYDERMTNAPHHLPVGTILRGQYLVGRVLGQGGFGITYLGRDINLNIPIAIKEYYPAGVVTRENTRSHSVTVATGGEDTRFTENRNRFLREARTLARLQDVPEVVQVMNFFEENNTAYIVMGYVRGITLKEHMRRNGGRLSAEETLQLLRPLLEAMGRVHAQGLVHRDISPDNIMLQPNGRVRLIDFGAAHAATGNNAQSTQAVLKHGFAPIEQYQSKGNLGPWTDVYAMCATIYCCLSGEVPPNATDRMVGEDDFAWEHLSDLTEWQKAALRRGLEPLYRRRTQSMEALCEGLFCKEAALIPESEEEKPEREEKQPEPEAELPATVGIGRKSISDTGTIALVGSGENPNHNAPLEIPESIQEGPYTAPVDRGDAPVQIVTAPVKQEAQEESGAREETDTEQKNMETDSHSWKKPVFGCAAIAVLLVICLLAFVPDRAKPDEPGYDSPTGSLPVVTEAENPVPASRILMEHLPVYVFNGEYDEYDSDANYAFGTKAHRNEVISITFLDTWDNAPEDAVDVSYHRDGSVLAWAEKKRDDYQLYIAAEGGVIAPENCSEMFSNFTNLEAIHFNGHFDTGNTTNMNGMFSSCYSLPELDVSGLDTAGVADMGWMFYGCSGLTQLNISGMDTGKVTDMSWMFTYCKQLTQLDVSGFDTGNVTNMNSMFEGCSGLTELDVSGFDTGKVTSLFGTFASCSGLTELDVSGFDTANVMDMSWMFYGCSSLKSLDVSGFETGKVIDMGYMFYGTDKLKNVKGSFDVGDVMFYDDFMDPKDNFNGKAWKRLFQ